MVHTVIDLKVAHRYLSDGKIEYICMSCFNAVCNVRSLEDADALIDRHSHICELTAYPSES